MIRPAEGLGPQGFDEKHIHGAADLRHHAHHLLHHKRHLAHEKVEHHAHEAHKIENPHVRKTYVESAQKEEVDSLYDESGVHEMLAKSLPKAEAEAFNAKLKGEWSEEFNVQGRTDDLLTEAERAKYPSPHAILKATGRGAAPEAPPPPPAAPPPPGEGPPTTSADDNMQKFWEELMKKLNPNGTKPIPNKVADFQQSSGLSTKELKEKIAHWDKAKGWAAQTEAYKEIEAALGPSQKKESTREESLIPKFGGEAGTAPLLRGAEAPPEAAAPEGPEAPPTVGAPPPTAGPSDDPRSAADLGIIQSLKNAFTYAFPRFNAEGHPLLAKILAELDKYANATPAELMRHLNEWATDLIRRGDPLFESLPEPMFVKTPSMKEMFKILTFVDTPDMSPVGREFSKTLSGLFSLGSGNHGERLLLKSFLDGYPDFMNTVFVFTYAFNKPAADAGFAIWSYLLGSGFFSRTSYVKYPGLTQEAIVALWGKIPHSAGQAGLYLLIPTPTPLDKALASAASWLYDRQDPTKNNYLDSIELAKLLFDKIYEFELAGKTISNLIDQWVKPQWTDRNSDLTKALENSSLAGRLEFQKITGYQPLADIRKLIDDWGKPPPGMTGPEKEFKARLLAELDKMAEDGWGLTQLRGFLNLTLFNRDIYFQFPGLTLDRMNDLIGKIGGLNPKDFTPLDDALNKAWNWMQPPTKEPDLTLAKYLFNKIMSLEGKEFKDLHDWSTEIWAMDPLPDALRYATPAGRIRFTEITGFQSLEAIKKIVENWGKPPNPALTGPERDFQRDLLKLIDDCITAGMSPAEFNKKLNNEFLNKNLYFEYPGLTDTRLLSLCGQIGGRPSHDADDLDRALWQAWQWQATPGDPNYALANLLFNHIMTLKGGNIDMLRKWARDEIWQKHPLPKEFSPPANLAGRLAFIGIIGYNPLTDYRNAVEAWQPTPPRTVPEGAFKEAILAAIRLGMTNGLSLGELRDRLNSTLFNKDIYFQFPGLTLERMNDLIGKIGGLTPQRFMPIDDALIKAWDWSEASDTPYSDPTLSTYLLNLIKRVHAQGGDFAALQTEVRRIWSNEPWPIELAQAHLYSKAQFMRITDVNPIADIKEKISHWGKTPAEIEFRERVLVYQFELGATVLDYRWILKTDYFDNYVYAHNIGLTPNGLKGLCDIMGMTRPNPSRMEEILIAAWGYKTITADGNKLFQALYKVLQEHPEWTQDQLKTLWWDPILKGDFWKQFPGLDMKTEGIKFQDVTKLEIPRRPGPDIDDEIDKKIDWIKGLYAMWAKIYTKVAGGYPDLDKSWNFLKTFFKGKELADVAKAYRITDPKEIKILEDLMLAIKDKDHPAGWLKSLLSLYTDAKTKLQEIKKEGRPITDLYDWANRLVIPGTLYPGLSLKDKQDLIELITK